VCIGEFDPLLTYSAIETWFNFNSHVNTEINGY
jgi:hypothetical protein